MNGKNNACNIKSSSRRSKKREEEVAFFLPFFEHAKKGEIATVAQIKQAFEKLVVCWISLVAVSYRVFFSLSVYYSAVVFVGTFSTLEPIQTVCIFTNSLIPKAESSRPYPLCLIPPKG